MYVILGVSVFGVAVFCERFGFLYLRLRLNTDVFLRKILFKVEQMDYRGALEECRRVEEHPLGRIFKAGLLKADKKDKDIERAIEESLMREIPKLKTRINYMSLFANVATLFGLLGTITGLMAAFEGVANADAALKQKMLADGISTAMLTTAFGLIVGIPCLIGYYVLNNRGNDLADQFEEKAATLFNTLSIIKRKEEN
ncbi:MAG: MotA/TolQ/ExbB proton channel family protein [bacterium]